MCRWLAYSGGPIRSNTYCLNQRITWSIKVSVRGPLRRLPTVTASDWLYGRWKAPGLFRSIRPAWNDANFRDLAAHIESRLFMAHVRATSMATVQETNCHPFRYKNWLFVHNGEIFEIEKFRKELLMNVAPNTSATSWAQPILEVMFHLALTFGLEVDPPGAVARMAGFMKRWRWSTRYQKHFGWPWEFPTAKTLYGFRYCEWWCCAHIVLQSRFRRIIPA